MTDTTSLPDDEPGALSVDEFSARFGVCRVTVYSELRAGRLTARKLGRRTLIPVAEAQRWFEGLQAYRPQAVAV